MCHIILGMPIIALALFYFLPFGKALAIYVPILVVSLLIYYKIQSAMAATPKGGRDEMIGAEGEVVRALRPEGKIKVKAEIWNARAKTALEEGERCRIVDFEGLTAIVVPLTTDRKEPSAGKR